MDTSQLYAVIGSLTTLIGILVMSFVGYHLRQQNKTLDKIDKKFDKIDTRLTSCRSHCELTSNRLYGKITDNRIELAKRSDC